jgi:hypothetical protein
MTITELNQRLRQGEIVPLAAEEWNELAVFFKEMERHHTFVVGDLLVLQGEVGLVAVDQPTEGKRFVRRLASIEEKDRFVRERLETYERMWDGCGCRIDYTR